MKKSFFLITLLAVVLSACGDKKKKEDSDNTVSVTASDLKFADFSGNADNKKNELYVLKNAKGVEVTIINFGARIVSVLVPDKNGEMRDVVLGFDNFNDYTTHRTDFGATIGRYANRIAGGKFTLPNRAGYTLNLNDGNNSLHGGARGFQYQMFDIVQLDSQSVECSYLSKDGEGGYPGNLQVTVTYKLTDDNAIDISYKATTDQLTVVNLTNHSYFNLSGDPNNTILDHVMFLDCDKYTPTNSELIPTGEIASLLKTPLDFTEPTPIGSRIDDTTFTALKYGNGYDHNYILNKPGDITNVVAKVFCPTTGISLEVYTDEPGIQLYTGNFLDGTVKGKKGIAYNKRTAFCLETQHFPDSPNHPEFPSTFLSPDSTYTGKCIYKFGIQN